MARVRDGRAAVDARPAVRRTLTRKGLVGESMRRHGSPPKSDSDFSRASMRTPFRSVVTELGLTSQQVWGLTKTDQERSTALEAALTAARRDDLEHGTNAAYVHGCVCTDCRERQQRRMGRKPAAKRPP